MCKAYWTVDTFSRPRIVLADLQYLCHLQLQLPISSVTTGFPVPELWNRMKPGGEEAGI